MTQRLNKNGIPILDPPGRNALPKRCRPDEHEFRPVQTTGRYAGTDHETFCQRLERRTEHICHVCGAREVVTKVEFEDPGW